MAPAMPVPSATNRNRSLPAAGAEPALGETAGAHVVAERHGCVAEAFLQQVAQGDVAPAEVRRVDGEALGVVHDPGHRDAGRGGRLAELPDAVRPQFGGEVQDRGHHGVGPAFPAGGAACLVQQRAVGADQGGLHPGAADIEGDDMSHPSSLACPVGRGLVHVTGVPRVAGSGVARESEAGWPGRRAGGRAAALSEGRSTVSDVEERPTALSERDRAVLDVAGRHWPTAGVRERAIRERLGMSPTLYYQLLNALLDDPRALAHAPMTVNRLRRARDSRRKHL